jgi:hypothetical protein
MEREMNFKPGKEKFLLNSHQDIWRWRKNSILAEKT